VTDFKTGEAVPKETAKFDQERTVDTSELIRSGKSSAALLCDNSKQSLDATRTVPHFFSDEPRRLFGVYYQPKAERTDAAPVLICPPIGHEYVRTYNLIRKLCTRLADKGFPALKFDYCGLGDSYCDGSEATVAEWRDNIRAAAAELSRRSGHNDLTVVGYRLGATLVAGIRLEKAAIRSLVLWDPIVDGTAYIAELQKLQRACLVDTLRFRDPQPHRMSDGELVGFRWPDRLVESVGKLKLLNRPFP
jgi:uncharacterized protein